MLSREHLKETSKERVTKMQERQDLTQGSMLRHVVLFSLPMLLGNLLQALYNTVDSIWVGQFLGPEALGAVSVSGPVIMVLVSSLMGLTMAATVLVAQYWGAKRYEMVTRTINNTLLLLSVISVVLTVLGIRFNQAKLRLINTPEEILPLASSYLNIFLLGLFFMFGYNVISAILRGLGDSITPLKFLALATVINIILDPLMILGIGPFPRMEVAGAALATTLAQGISFIAAAWYLNRQGHLLRVNLREFKFDKDLT